MNRNTYQLEILRVCSGRYINYSYLIVDRKSRQAAVVDPAWQLEAIESALERYEAELSTILLTHSHKDHVHLVPPLCQRYAPHVFMMQKELDYYHFSAPSLYGLKDGEELKVGHTSITGLLTPGHTAGGGCYWLEGSLFTGDTIFTEGCGMCSSEGSDPVEMYYSVKRLQQLMPADTRVYPGHSFGERPGQSMSRLHEMNAYFQIASLEHFVSFRMRKGQTSLMSFH
ncbi:MBL fold metallo-hydrolase [Paenibacillus sp. F411]|uniref:Hydroxyacylglutathione hydrolase n=1 Tax=Paenibacillus algicola TaxID=2565926 RepID=A0A4P8XR26_9BACL|nr:MULTISPECIES: MBL fold metallo-hydrolase [Paenibacillus]MBO2945605.1 MBL fold metallo-hydrolase [Paenibacillus sp. F411]QCT04330.1 hydroxyacylglutathione hydrolase [Paenibacillus algicola]